MEAALVFLGLAILAAAFVLMSVRIYQIKPVLVGRVFRYGLIGAFAIGFCVAAIAIGMRIESRHKQSYFSSFKAVTEIWGGPIVQQPPVASYQGATEEQYLDQTTNQYRFRTKTGEVFTGFEEQRVRASIRKNVRRKGLLVFPGYRLLFSSAYVLKNATPGPQKFSFRFPLPTGAGSVSRIAVKLDGAAYSGDTNLADGVAWTGDLAPGQARTLEIAYEAQGTETFTYALADKSSEIRRLDASVETDFTDVTIPDGAMIPSSDGSDNQARAMGWKAENLVSSQSVALTFDVPGNYGKIVSKMFLYAPLPILLFVAYLVIVCVARGIELHPMHYLFILASFFIYYLLGSYLMSYVSVVAAIMVSLVVSGTIAEYYVHLIGKGRGLVVLTAVGVIVFQWIFSVAFFFPAHTGLVITLASIAGFVVLARLTARVEWENKW